MTDNLLTQLAITSDSTRPGRNGGMILTGARVSVGLPFEPARFLRHGWQSWSLTAWTDAAGRLPRTRPTLLYPMHTDPRYAGEKRPNGSWYGAVETGEGRVLLLGALDLESHVLLDGRSLTGRYESGTGEWFVAAGEEGEVLARYAALLAERLGRGRAEKPPRVWCSWYSLYTEIHEGQLLKILADLGDLPFDVFQIDDGWQKGIGDWEPNAKFPSGMDGMAARIKATGRTAGLWLAPLLVVPTSELFRQHPDWLLRDARGRLVSAGFNWGEAMFTLDTTHPEALAWLAGLMQKVRAWGYDYVKLDFLYAGALPGKRHTDLPREAAFRQGLQTIRTALGDAYFLTCGTPIFPSLGLCDGMRVGPDVAGHWQSRRDDQVLVNFAIPGSRNALRTSLNRLWLQPLVHTDPDVIYFRRAQTSLTDEQRSLLQDLGRAAGFRATSDVPAWLSAEERQALKTYFETEPEVERTGRTAFRIGGRAVDFAPHINLPPLPGFFTRLEGALVGGLASVPIVMRTFDALGQQGVKKTLDQHPV